MHFIRINDQVNQIALRGSKTHGCRGMTVVLLLTGEGADGGVFTRV